EGGPSVGEDGFWKSAADGWALVVVVVDDETAEVHNLTSSVDGQNHFCFPQGLAGRGARRAMLDLELVQVAMGRVRHLLALLLPVPPDPSDGLDRDAKLAGQSGLGLAGSKATKNLLDGCDRKPRGAAADLCRLDQLPQEGKQLPMFPFQGQTDDGPAVGFG